MISESFTNVLVSDIQNIDPSLSSVGVEVASYVDPTSNKNTFPQIPEEGK